PSPATPTTGKPTASNESVRIGCFFLSIVIFLSNSNLCFYMQSSIRKLHTNRNERQNLLSTKNVQQSYRSFKTISTLRSEEHTSELQSRFALVCRLLLE